jgi:hypothetical protein
MTKKDLLELIRKTLQEYTGTGASGGNAGDGNSITAPGIPYDDEEAIERYTNKSIYGGDGGHYKNYVKTNNYNSLNHRVKFEEIDADDYGDVTLTTQGQMKSRFTKTGRPPGIWENKKSLNEDLASDQAQEKQDHEEDGIAMEIRHATERFQEAMKQQNASASQLKTQLNKTIDGLKQRLRKIQTGGGGGARGGAPSGGGAPAGAAGGEEGSPTQEQLNKNKNNTLDMNLIEILNNEKKHLTDNYTANLRRSFLMENTMKSFFNKFEGGMTNEEIVQDYALQGTQVPESLVGRFRKQFEEYKKLQLELEMSEKEFKNSAKEIVNNPEENTTTEEDPKQLASGLFKEEILKNQIRKELKKIK